MSNHSRCSLIPPHLKEINTLDLETTDQTTNKPRQSRLSYASKSRHCRFSNAPFHLAEEASANSNSNTHDGIPRCGVEVSGVHQLGAERVPEQLRRRLPQFPNAEKLAHVDKRIRSTRANGRNNSTQTQGRGWLTRFPTNGAERQQDHTRTTNRNTGGSLSLRFVQAFTSSLHI